MTLRHRHLRQISSFLPHFSSGYHYQLSKRVPNSVASSSSFLPQQCHGINNVLPERFSVSFRHSTISQPSPDPSSEAHLLSFIESIFDQPQGTHHCWFNRDDKSKDSLKKDGTFLIIAGRFLKENAGCDPVVMCEKVKLLQQRFPRLRVIGLQQCNSIRAADVQSQLVQLIMKEYITYPILLSNKNFSQLTDGVSYILSKDLKNSVVYHEKDVDLAVFNKATEELSVEDKVNPVANNFKSSWSKEAEIIKEPHICTALRNFLLYFPASVCADESGERLFLSDSNHHRIIIFDGDGKILDSIGSCPGFEDGEFESAKLLRPAASFYHAFEDCLYIVDSENHAIRRADLERRILETVYPSSSINKKNINFWTWIRNKLGFGTDADVKYELMCPWHLINSGDDGLLIISRSLEALWVMDFASGEIEQVVEGFSNILEFCRPLIMEKISLLKMMPDHLLQQQTDMNLSPVGLPYADLISCVTKFQNHIIMCDSVGQGVMKLSRESGFCSRFQFSNLRMLGLPYWLSFPLERFYAVAAGLSPGQTDHMQQFNLLPGRVDIRLSIDIPADTVLVEPLHESCIWCQARGTATEVSLVEGLAGSSEKVGVAQQWYDELDNLAFSTSEPELIIEEDNSTTDTNTEDEKVHINCVVNASPGTSEVIVFAPLYLKLRKNHGLEDNNQEKFAARIADILGPDGVEGYGSNSCIQFLLKSNRDLRDLVFVKPLHVRIKFNCQDHPKADNSKGIILTDSSVNVDVCLKV